MLTLELNEHVDIVLEYLTLRNIIHSFKVRGDPAVQSIKRTAETGKDRFLYHVKIEKYDILRICLKELMNT
jgi:hypothetical protein